MTASGNSALPASRDKATSCRNSFAEVHPFENHTQHDHEHRKPDPVGVRVYLANIIVLGFTILLERRLRLPEIPVGRCAKGLSERSAHVIERLVLNEERILQSVEHAEGGESHPAEDQKFARAGHHVPSSAPRSAASRPPE